MRAGAGNRGNRGGFGGRGGNTALMRTAFVGREQTHAARRL